MIFSRVCYPYALLGALYLLYDFALSELKIVINY